SDFDAAYNVATGGENGLDPNGRYLALAPVNWDHFGDHAGRAYEAGHQWAVQDASSLQDSSRTPDQKLVALGNPYAYNALADHFLTDLFASGHLRTPRKELHDQCGVINGDPVGDLLARCMHNQDNWYGLTVYNANKETWTCYGDNRLCDTPDAQNLTRVEA